MYYSTPLRISHTSISWWFITAVFVTASLLKSQGLFSVFWPILIMLLFGWFQLDLFFPSPNPFINPLGTLSSAPITTGTTVNFMFHNFFSSLPRSQYFSFFSLSFSFILWPAGSAKLTFFVDYHQVWSSGRDSVICLYFKIPDKIVRLIF